jgi:hypothetical protein
MACFLTPLCIREDQIDISSFKFLRNWASFQMIGLYICSIYGNAYNLPRYKGALLFYLVISPAIYASIRPDII